MALAFCEHAASGEKKKKNSDVENTAILKGFQSKKNLCFKIREKMYVSVGGPHVASGISEI